MFTPEDLEKDASLLLDLKEDVREECSMLGEVTNVVLYDVGIPQVPLSLADSIAERKRWNYDGQISRSNKCTGLCPRM